MAVNKDAAERMADWRTRHHRGRNTSHGPGTAGGTIVAWLAANGPARLAEIVAGTGLTYNSVTANLTGLVAEKKVERPRRAVYQVPGGGQA